jgi:ribosomal RNA-processing protein 8
MSGPPRKRAKKGGTADFSRAISKSAKGGNAKRPSKKKRARAAKQQQGANDEAAAGNEPVQQQQQQQQQQHVRQPKKMFSSRVDLDAPRGGRFGRAALGGVSGVGGPPSSGAAAGSPGASSESTSSSSSSTSSSSTTSSSSSASLRRKLAGGQFRWLNEQLYTQRGAQAKAMFAEKPELFDAYHLGFAAQLESWPVNPLDAAIAAALALPPGSQVADMGCGEARLAQTVEEHGRLAAQRASSEASGGGNGATAEQQQQLSKSQRKRARRKRKREEKGKTVVAAEEETADGTKAEKAEHEHTGEGISVSSFDLHAPNRFVTVANIANVPLSDASVDLCVFCLSLMGVDYIEYLREARRILRVGGALFVAEVRSRFEAESRWEPTPRSELDEAQQKPAVPVGSGVKAFRSAVESLGFEVAEEDATNQMFIRWTFRKTENSKKKVAAPELRACQYKKR